MAACFEVRIGLPDSNPRGVEQGRCALTVRAAKAVYTLAGRLGKVGGPSVPAFISRRVAKSNQPFDYCCMRNGVMPSTVN